jgi:transcription-repair coupling factor (superfamily II helicase)
VLKCYFINRPDSPYFESELFQNIIQYLQTGTNQARLKQTGKLFLMVMEPARSMQDVYSFLKKMHTSVARQPAEV